MLAVRAGKHGGFNMALSCSPDARLLMVEILHGLKYQKLGRSDSVYMKSCRIYAINGKAPCMCRTLPGRPHRSFRVDSHLFHAQDSKIQTFVVAGVSMLGLGMVDFCHVPEAPSGCKTILGVRGQKLTWMLMGLSSYLKLGL